MRAKISSFFLIFFISLFISAQSNNQELNKRLSQAIDLMDNGNINESIAILNELTNIEPNNFEYFYELAYAYYIKQDYTKTIEILEKLKSNKDAYEILYQLLGNSYDMLGQSKNAIEVYDEGLKKFPNKGNLYLEKGIVYEIQKKYEVAIENYKKGIKAEPKYSSNYYRLATLYLKSKDIVPGLIYGEIFINLERTTKRTKEISEKLFNGYKNAVTFENKELKQLNFCKEVIIDFNKFEENKKLPLCMIFTSTLVLPLTSINEISLDNLSKVRQKFIELYFQKYNNQYPNILFDYHKQMIEQSVFEAYNYYIFQMGAQDEFANWLENHQDQYNKFVDWYTDKKNIINPTQTNFFNFEY